MENKEIKRISAKYEEKGRTQLDEIKELDLKAKRPAIIFGAIFGAIALLVLGFGMSICLGAILKDYLWIGIVVGVSGLLLCALDLLLVNIILKKGKEKYGPKILEIANK